MIYLKFNPWKVKDLETWQDWSSTAETQMKVFWLHPETVCIKTLINAVHMTLNSLCWRNSLLNKEESKKLGLEIIILLNFNNLSTFILFFLNTVIQS